MPLSENDIKDLIIKEMDYVQSVISRMASNSFQLKGWLIGILSFIMAFNKETIFAGNPAYILMLGMPVLIFWYLDAFFLYTEQRYRDMYNDIYKNRIPSLFPGGMPEGLKDLFNLDYTRYEHYTVARRSVLRHMGQSFSRKVFQSPKEANVPLPIPPKAKTIFDVMWSKTLLAFYLLPLVFICLIAGSSPKKDTDKVQQIEIKGISDANKPVVLQLDAATMELLKRLEKLQQRPPEASPSPASKEKADKPSSSK